MLLLTSREVVFIFLFLRACLLCCNHFYAFPPLISIIFNSIVHRIELREKKQKNKIKKIKQTYSKKAEQISKALELVATFGIWFLQTQAGIYRPPMTSPPALPSRSRIDLSHFKTMALPAIGADNCLSRRYCYLGFRKLWAIKSNIHIE